MKTMEELAQEALWLQDAVNLSGLVHNWSVAISELQVALATTDAEVINRHPISRLWASKVA